MTGVQTCALPISVWFGCDCGKFSSREDGMFCDDLYGVEALLGTDFTMTKAERLDYKESLMTHAMVFQGVNIGADGKPNRWRVENSWGEEAGKKGYYVMSDEWFSQYVYQVVVNRKFLTAVKQRTAAFILTLALFIPSGAAPGPRPVPAETISAAVTAPEAFFGFRLGAGGSRTMGSYGFAGNN